MNQTVELYLRLPTELLYIIISTAVSEYLDDVVAGPYALPRPKVVIADEVNQEIAGALAILAEADADAIQIPEDVVPDVTGDDGDAHSGVTDDEGEGFLGAAGDEPDVLSNTIDVPVRAPSEASDEIPGRPHDGDQVVVDLPVDVPVGQADNNQSNGQETAAERLAKTLVDVKDPALEAPNPIVSLLQAGMQLRLTTLLVLSEALGIPVIEEGAHRLESKPWSRIQMMRGAYTDSDAYAQIMDPRDIDVFTSSQLVATYVLLGVNYSKLREAEQEMSSVARGNAIEAFKGCRLSIQWLLESMQETDQCVWAITKMELRTKALRRVREWNIKVTDFLCLKVCLPTSAAVFDLIKNAEGMALRTLGPCASADEQAQEKIREMINEAVNGAYSLLQDLLQTTLTTGRMQRRISELFNNVFSDRDEELRAAVQILDKLRDYVPETGDAATIQAVKALANQVEEMLITMNPSAKLWESMKC